MPSFDEPPPPYDARDRHKHNADQQAEQEEQQLLRLIVGVDFGTTFTGVSFISNEGTHVKIAEDVTCVDDWPGPGRGGDASWKCPTRIAYSSDNGSANNSWGFEVKPGPKSYAWFKLLLDEQQATRYDHSSSITIDGQNTTTKPAGKSAVDLCADFLAEVATFAYKSMARRVTEEVLKSTPLDFWFTVPAMWSDRAKADTLKAAQKAAKLARIQCHHDSRVFLIQEPEAAAVATLSLLTKGGYGQLVKSGDSVLICDCGGGTVDLTSYKVTSINPKLAFEELIVGTGGKCGSTFIDREFVRWMETKFGARYTTLPEEKRGPASPLMKEFEAAKRDFGKLADSQRASTLQVYLRNFPDSDYYDESCSELKIPHSDMKRMFDVVLEKIIALLQSQLALDFRQHNKATIRTVFLVGGFGDSAYLNTVLVGWCQKRNVRLLCPQHPQSAIVRGAALSGLLRIQPSSRRCRRHYGFEVSEPFDPLRHRAQDTYVCDWTGKLHARGNMRWDLKKGEVIDPTSEIVTELHFPKYDDQMAEDVTLDVYGSELDEAPLYRHDPGSKVLATIKHDFSGLDLSQLATKVKNGRKLRKLVCKYTISFGHRQGVLHFGCTANGQEVGATSIAFDGQGVSELQQNQEESVDEGGFSPPCAMQ